MKAVVAAFNQEKALVGAFYVIVQPVVEPMDRFAALLVNIEWAIYSAGITWTKEGAVGPPAEDREAGRGRGGHHGQCPRPPDSAHSRGPRPGLAPTGAHAGGVVLPLLPPSIISDT